MLAKRAMISEMRALVRAGEQAVARERLHQEWHRDLSQACRLSMRAKDVFVSHMLSAVSTREQQLPTWKRKRVMQVALGQVSAAYSQLPPSVRSELQCAAIDAQVSKRYQRFDRAAGHFAKLRAMDQQNRDSLQEVDPSRFSSQTLLKLTSI